MRVRGGKFCSSRCSLDIRYTQLSIRVFSQEKGFFHARIEKKLFYIFISYIIIVNFFSIHVKLRNNFNF